MRKNNDTADTLRLGRILEELCKPSAAAGGGRRKLAPGLELVPAILREIDDAVLPRQLTFADDRGARLTVEVANRRALSFAPAPDAAGFDFAAWLRDGPAPTGEADRFALLKAHLNALFADAGAVSVAAQALPQAVQAGDIGCSSEQFAREWSIDLQDAADAEPSAGFEGFLDSCQGYSPSWVLYSGDKITRKSGADKDIAQLTRFGQNRLAQIDAQMADLLHGPTTARCSMLEVAEDDIYSIAYVKSKVSKALLLVPNENVLKVHSIWQKAFVDRGGPAEPRV